MPRIDGIFNSIGPAVVGPDSAPSSSARLKACAASRTRKPIAQIEPP